MSIIPARTLSKIVQIGVPERRTHCRPAPSAPRRPTATVLLLGPFRDAAYVRQHVAFVVRESAEKGEEHIIRNLLSIRHKLEVMGIDRRAIDREVDRIEGAVRAELWRQVLLPEPR